MSPLIDKKLCAPSTAGRTFTSATNKLRLEFASDFSQSAKGFNITYRTKAQGRMHIVM